MEMFPSPLFIDTFAFRSWRGDGNAAIVASMTLLNPSHHSPREERREVQSTLCCKRKMQVPAPRPQMIRYQEVPPLAGELWWKSAGVVL